MTWFSDLVSSLVKRYYEKHFRVGGAVSGLLLDQFKSPISGAVIVLKSHDDEVCSMPTSSDGSFSISDLNSSYTISVRLSDSLHDNLTSIFVPDGEHLDNLVLNLCVSGKSTHNVGVIDIQTKSGKEGHSDVTEIGESQIQEPISVSDEGMKLLETSFVKRGSYEQREFLKHLKNSIYDCGNYSFGDIFCGVYLSRESNENTFSCIGFVSYSRVFGGADNKSIFVLSSRFSYELDNKVFTPVYDVQLPIQLRVSTNSYIDSEYHWVVNLSKNWEDSEFVQKVIQPVYDFQVPIEQNSVFKSSKTRRKNLISQLTNALGEKYSLWSDSHPIELKHNFRNFQSKDGTWSCSYLDWYHNGIQIALDIGIYVTSEGSPHKFYFYFFTRNKAHDYHQFLQKSGFDLKFQNLGFKDDSYDGKVSYKKEIVLSQLSEDTFFELVFDECELAFPVISEVFEQLATDCN